MELEIKSRCIVTVTVLLHVMPVLTHLVIKPTLDPIKKPLGSSIAITCSSTSTNNIKWLDTSGKDISNIPNNRIFVDAFDSSSKKLIITSIQHSDTGRYTCIGNVSGVLQEKSIRLDIFKDITFDEVPLYQNLVIHTDSTIICKVSGEPEPIIFWNFNHDRISLGDKYVQTRDGLKVINVTEHDGGLYSCIGVVENAGLYETRNIDVTVHVPPKVVRGVGKNEAVQGENFTFVCHADGLPPPTFEFYKMVEGGTMTKVENDHPRVILGTDSLALRPTTKADEGYYKCVAKNPAGINESAVGLFKVFAPAKILEFQDIIVNEGSTAEMTCITKGDPEPVVVFDKKQAVTDHVRISTNTTDIRMKSESVEKNVFQLQLPNSVPEDSGTYYCAASNSFAKDIKYAKITVQYSPRILTAKTLPSTYMWAEISKNLTVYFCSYPVPSVSWFFGSSELKPNATFKIFIGDNFTSLQVHIREIDQAWIYGQYHCILKNIIGETRTSIELKRATTPDSPSVKVLKSHATDAWLLAEPPEEDGGVPINGYVIQNQGRIYEFSLGEEIRVTDLRPNTVYLLTVKAKNAVGTGVPRQIKLQTTGMSEPVIHIIEDRVQTIRAFEYRIFWKVNTTGGMPILEYEVLYKKLQTATTTDTATFLHSPALTSDSPSTPFEDFPVEDDSEKWLMMKVKDNIKHPISDLVVPDLEQNSHYLAKIRARNAIDWSHFTKLVTFSTAEASQAELEMKNSMKNSNLFLVIIALFISFLIILSAIIDVMCCYCCDRGLTKHMYSKCFKAPPQSSSEKQSLSLLENKFSKECKSKSSCSKKEKNGERDKFKKKPNDAICEPVPV